MCSFDVFAPLETCLVNKCNSQYENFCYLKLSSNSSLTGNFNEVINKKLHL